MKKYYEYFVSICAAGLMWLWISTFVSAQLPYSYYREATVGYVVWICALAWLEDRHSFIRHTFKWINTAFLVQPDTPHDSPEHHS